MEDAFQHNWKVPKKPKREWVALNGVGWEMGSLCPKETAHLNAQIVTINARQFVLVCRIVAKEQIEKQ